MTTLMAHVGLARDAMREHYGHGEAYRSYQDAVEGMGALRVLASFILALHPGLAGDDDETREDRAEALAEVINDEITDEEFLARMPDGEVT